MSDLNLKDDPRAGLELTRWHSWAVHRRQSVGEHSAQIMRILLTIWPDCPRRMLVHALMHDIGEMAGDAQWPFKKTVPGLKDAHDRAEEMVRASMREKFGLPPDVVLNDYERRVFKLCDMLEMWEFALREVNMGNRYCQFSATSMLLEASAWLESLGDPPPGAQDVRPAVKRYVDTRTQWELGQ